MQPSTDDDFKNALPHESDDHSASDMPHQLRTQNENDDASSEAEATAAGMITPVYGEASSNPNADDARDAHHGSANDST